MAKQTAFDSKLHSILADHMSALVAEITNAVRQNIANQIGFLLTPSTPGAAKATSRRTARSGKRQVVTCIAPNCTNPSKGPRFHYLCDKHVDAPKRDYEAWRKAKTAKNASA